MYYKIITPYSWFAKTYQDVDVLDIPYGTVFDAPQKCRYKPDDSRILLGKNCFHFADGVLDTMLWHTQLTHRNVQFQVYAIEPLAMVEKARCRDGVGLYQCGTEKIKILDKQNIDELYETAIKEYAENRDKYKNFDIDLDLWKRHQTTVFFTYVRYDSLLWKSKLFTKNTKTL